jgi:nucleotide-binding universal stress UspA family protein
METKMNNIILVPADFSEVCNNAMKQAVEAAKFLKYKVVLLHVIDKNSKSQLKKDGTRIILFIFVSIGFKNFVGE